LVKRSRTINKLLIVVVSAVIYFLLLIGIFSTSFAIDRSTVLTIIAIVFTVISFVILLFWTQERAEYVKSINTQLQTYKAIIDMKTHTYHVIEAIKEINILDSDGTAEVRYSFNCENTSDKTLKYIRFRVSHDGQLESLRCSLDDEELEPVDRKDLLTVDAQTKNVVGLMPFTTIFRLKSKDGIRPNARFRYSYSYKGNKMYPKIMEEKKEYSQTQILHPTSCLVTIIEAPKGYIFSGFQIEVIDRDEMKHEKEEERIGFESPPMLVDQRRRIIWTLKEPMLAEIYRICFSIKPLS
jgi:hypothetical protein